LRNFYLYIFIFISLIFTQEIVAQQATLRGFVKDEMGHPVPMTNIAIKGTTTGTSSSDVGYYELSIPPGDTLTIIFSHTGFVSKEEMVFGVRNENITLNIRLNIQSIEGVTITDSRTRASTMSTIEPKTIYTIPTVSGSIESLLASQPGVAMNNELSSAYSVRGGNFDENLVYVNDIEVYRPFLVRSGQQEGLSFVNPFMVSNINFSAGGFEARYGDKMSSVLDIRYKSPKTFGGSASASLLGASVHLENTSKNYRFRQIHGIRYRNNAYVLGSLDVEGDYQPNFLDYQTYLSYDISDRFEINFLGNYSRNQFKYVPQSRTSEFGSINEALRLNVFFSGQEVSQFETFFGAFSGNYQVNKELRMKFIASAFRTFESENFDILGQYRLEELERDFGSDDFGDVRNVRGIGGYMDHARNNLDALVYNLEYRGWLDKGNSDTEWGVRLQREEINDRLSEWRMIDSAGYSVPRLPMDEIQLFEVIKSQIRVESFRSSGFIQNTRRFFNNNDDEWIVNVGLRATHWTFSNEFNLSPRFNIAYKPFWVSEKNDTTKYRDVLFRFSSGYYYQPPFYRELRDFDGMINPELRAQKSIHFVLGADVNFKMWGRPFKFTGELYYKHLENLIPYQIDNVRVRYYAENNATGYARGLDLKLNGEFIKGIESWASLSFMSTKENILDDFYYEYFNADGERIIPGFTFDQNRVDSTLIEPGMLPRPTDQLVNFGLFFQDELPQNPNYKVHLNMLFGSRLPFGPPTRNRYQQTLRTPPYRRVDIGFSRQLMTKKDRYEDKKLAKHVKDMWITLEVFNLLDINNTISYLWVRDSDGRQYAVPSYLTGRRINIKAVVIF
jgi:hypothetical protein